MPSFSLASVFWAFAVVAAASASLGPSGVVFGVAVIAFWMRMFHTSPIIPLLEWCVLLILMGLLVAFVLPRERAAMAAARRAACLSNLETIGQALLREARHRGTLPPAAAPFAEQLPPRSWRLLLLPPLEQQALGDAYHQDQSWYSQGNLAIRETPLDIYACPGHSATNASPPETDYFAVVGPHAAFLRERGRSWREFTDQRAETILIIEAAGRSTPWLKPEDLSFDEAVDLLTGQSTSSVGHDLLNDDNLIQTAMPERVVNVVFADGSAGSLNVPISRELATALLTIDGGKEIDVDELHKSIDKSFDARRWSALGAFGALALLPVARWLRQRAPARVLLRD